MNEIRLNQLIKWYHKNEKLTILVDTKKVTLSNQMSLIELLYDLTEKYTSISIDRISLDYKISKDIISFLTKLNVLIYIENCDGPESKIFHNIAKNPSTTILEEQLDEGYVQNLYKNIQGYFYDSLGNFSRELYNLKSINLKDKLLLKHTNSSRKDKNSNKSIDKKNEILSLISHIFSYNGEQHTYGSAGGFYNIYPILIFNDNSFFCFDRFLNCFYTGIKNKLFSNVSECFIHSEFNDFLKYQCHIIFVSCYKGVLSKYGNRGYKYIQMEAGAIATLIRQGCANLGIPQVEVQGYFDDALLNIMLDLGMDKEKTLLIHTMCLN